MKNLIVLTIFSLAIMFVACEQQDLLSEEINDGILDTAIERTDISFTVNAASVNRNVDMSYTLYAGQTIEAGEVLVSVDGDMLVVTYMTNADWQLGTTHLYAGSCDEIPLTGSGNPKIGHFPYVIEGRKQDQVEYRIPLSEITIDNNDPSNPAGCFCFAAHAELHKTGNGSGNGNSNGNGNGGGSETGWADWTTEFDGNRWGGFNEVCL